jgi:alpha-ketoglutarate-dependent taurine dioxygenase
VRTLRVLAHDAGTVTVQLEGRATPSVFHRPWLWHNSAINRHADSGQLILAADEVATGPALTSACVERADAAGGALAVDVSLHSTPATAAADGRALTVTWAGGARSSFTERFLAAHDYSDEALLRAHVAATPATLRSVAAPPQGGVPAHAAPPASHVPRHPPIGTDAVPAFTFQEVMGTEEGLYAWLRALNEYGLTLVRGAGVKERTVLELASRIAYPQWTIYGEVWDVAVTPNPINIAYAPVMLDAHVDLVYYESPPGLQLLHCRRFDDGVVGGESTFIDGFYAAELLRQRDPAAFAVLATVPATFQKVHYARARPAHIVASRPIITVDRSAADLVGRLARSSAGAEVLASLPPAQLASLRDGEVTGVFWAPPFEGPLRVPADQVEVFYPAYDAFARLLREVEHDGRHLVQYRMQPGDVSVFNNRRMLHGRRHFAAAAGSSTVDPPQRVLQGCYVNIDEFKSRFAHLAAVRGQADTVRRVANQCWY